MSKKPLNISEEAAVQMPMKTVASLITLVAIGTWAFFGVQETLNQHSTKIELMQKDLEHNTEFRIKYPRGELGQSSGEAELFMLVEHMAGLIESMDEELKNMRNNKINIDFLKEQVSKLQSDVEKLIGKMEHTDDRVSFCIITYTRPQNYRTSLPRVVIKMP
jgi:peptidoglycan hydrolase CwlO-like protein